MGTDYEFNGNRSSSDMIFATEKCSCAFSDEPGVSLVDNQFCSGTLLFMVFLESFLKGRCNIATPCDRITSTDETKERYDYIVVGGGSAGSIVAGRLSEKKKSSVLLIEAGYEEPIGARPPSLYRTFWGNDKIDWRYRTVPDNYCLDQGGKGCEWPRGKVLGGSSVLNGMMYHRGHPADYEDWEKAGAKGWSWKKNLKFFDMTEGNKEIGSLVDKKYHSRSGPLPVQRFRYQPPFVFDLLSAMNESGLPVITDMNDPDTPDGFTIAQTFNQDGQRYTTARAYLKPKHERPNLSVKLNAHVSRVLFENKRAVGVEYIDKDGQKKTVHASKEIILSAGSLNTPHILLLSGIGPKETLEKFNIPVVEDLPVGQNLRNHYGMTLYFILTKLNNTEVLDWSVLTKYLLDMDGPMSSTGITQVTGILYSSLADIDRQQPDIQFFFNGFYAECSKEGIVGDPATNCTQNGRNISANAAILKPRSVGYLTLNSSDPLDPPLFNPQYFSNEKDLIMIKDGARYLQMIYESDIMQNKYGIQLDSSYTDICSSTGDAFSDKWIECMARQHTDPQNHQVGTASIGKVIDTDLKVYNIKGLRVIDASALPSQTTGNPQGAIMMVAERGAHLIKNDH